jgi:hypothetical protein
MTVPVTLVSEGDLLSAVFDLPAQPRRLALLIGGRGTALRATARALTLCGMGVPLDYLDPEVRAALSGRWGRWARRAYLETVIQRRTTPRGVFAAVCGQGGDGIAPYTQVWRRTRGGPALAPIWSVLCDAAPDPSASSGCAAGAGALPVAGPDDLAELLVATGGLAGPALPPELARRTAGWCWARAGS